MKTQLCGEQETVLDMRPRMWLEGTKLIADYWSKGCSSKNVTESLNLCPVRSETSAGLYFPPFPALPCFLSIPKYYAKSGEAADFWLDVHAMPTNKLKTLTRMRGCAAPPSWDVSRKEEMERRQLQGRWKGELCTQYCYTMTPSPPPKKKRKIKSVPLLLFISSVY